MFSAWTYPKFGAAIGACLLAAAPLQNGNSLLDQVKRLASQGQDSQTTSEVSQYVDQNKSEILDALKTGMQDLNSDAPGDQPAPGAQAQPSSGAQSAPELNSAEIQPSSGLVTAHLAGYPSLPDVDPISSVTHPTREQLAYAATVQREMQARKQFLMTQPVEQESY